MRAWLAACCLSLLASAPAGAREVDPTLPLVLVLEPAVVSRRLLPEASLPRTMQISFRLRVASSIAHAPVVTRERSILVAHGEPVLAEYDARGRVAWAARLSSAAAASPFVFADGTRAVVTQSGELLSFSRRGLLLRRSRLPFASAGDGLIVEGSADGGVFLAEHGRSVRLDPTGSAISETQIDAEIRAVLPGNGGATQSGRATLLVTAGGSVYELSADGRAALRARFGGRVTAAARLDTTRVLAVLDERRLVELDIATDTEKVRAESAELELSGPLALDAKGESRLVTADFLLAFDAQHNERFRVPLAMAGAPSAGRDSAIDFVLDGSGTALVVREGAGLLSVAADGTLTRFDGSACPEPLRPAVLSPSSAIVACGSGVLLRFDGVPAPQTEKPPAPIPPVAQ